MAKPVERASSACAIWHGSPMACACDVYDIYASAVAASTKIPGGADAFRSLPVGAFHAPRGAEFPVAFSMGA